MAALIGLLASIPFLKGIPEGGDTFLHFYRLVQLDTLVGQGIIFSRWAPDLAYGYGYPIFNYYAPFSYYLAEFLHLLGLDLISAFLATFIVAFVGAAVFTYLWIRDLFGDIAGLVAAAMYTLSPYLMIDALQRGALAEHLALSLLPLILYAFRRLIVLGGWTYALIATLSYACLLLTHNITALIFTPILLAYILVISWQSKKQSASVWSGTMRSALPCLGFLILAIGITAFFWIPALFERELVQIIQSYGPIAFDFKTNFQNLAASLAPPFIWDPNLINRNVPIALSLFGLFLAFIGTVGTFRFYQWGDQRANVIFAAAVSLLSVFMTASLSEVVWNVLPLIAFVQFPWRFLGMATLFVALLAGAGADSLLRLTRPWPRLQTAIPAVLVGLVILYILPWQFADYSTTPPEATISASIAYEREFGTIGTTSTGEYLPVNVKQLPSPDPLIESAISRQLIEESLPSAAIIKEAIFKPLEYRLTVDSPEAFLAEFNTFFFEGWRAYIDGHLTSVRFSEPDGLIEVEVPAGEHQLLVQFESTTIRDIAKTLSFISLAALIIALIVWGKRPYRSPGYEALTPNSPTIPQLGLIFIVLVSIFAGKWLFLDDNDSAIRRSRLNGQIITGVSNTNQKNFDDKLILLGLDAPDHLEADQLLEVTLYWRLAEDVGEDFSTSVVVVSENGEIVGQSDKQHPGVIPTSQWSEGKYAADRHQISLMPGIPPGPYTIEINAYRYNEPENRLNILDDSGAPIGQSLSAAPIELQAPREPVDLSQIDMETKSNLSLGQGINLLGYSLPEKTMFAGQTLPIVLYWRATNMPGQDSFVKLELIDEDGITKLSAEVPLVPGFPTSQWQTDDLWRGSLRLSLPASLDKGAYQLAMTTDTGEVINLNAINIDTPAHLYDPPDMTFRQEMGFGQVANLIGYDLPLAIGLGKELPVTLLWQSQGETPINYKSFVQLLDDSGRLIVGSDAIPDEWRRPTTGWVADEFITDSHHLVVPEDLIPGSYQLLIGLYDMISLERISTDAGDNALILNRSIEIVEE
jgi:hypothetical protein